MNKHNQILLSIRNSKKIINTQGTKYQAVKEAAYSAGFQLNQDCFTFYWTDQALSSKQIRDLPPHIKINHFSQITILTRKNRLAYALNTMKRYFLKDYDFFPDTYLLPMDYSLMQKSHKKNKYYIVKPQNGCQGRGIYLVDNPNKIEKSSQIIVQKYISNPMLIDNLKFDLRVYVLITCIQPLRVYLYKDGLVRFATQQFETPNDQNLNDLFKHLTNYAINKNHQSFTVEQENHAVGHKRLMSSLFSQQMMCAIHLNISDIVIKSIISVLPSLQNASQLNKRQHPNSCFQLLGYDIMMTDNGKFKLIEINQNPSLMTDTPVDRKIKKQMLKSIFQMVQIPVHQHQQRYQNIIKNKDKHQMSKLGKFGRIYPCEHIQETQKYDKFMLKSIELFRDRFGKSMSRQKQKKQTPKNCQHNSIQWNLSSQFYSKDKLQQVYRPRTMTKTSHRKRMVYF